MSELIFAKDEVIVRTRIKAPLVGETVHEEKLPYDKLQVDGLQLTISSIDRTFDDTGNLTAISFKVKEIEPGRKAFSPKDELELPLTSAMIMYGYINATRDNRRFFPGFKIPFTLRDGNKEYQVHVTGAGSPDVRLGDPTEGGQIVGGLKAFFVEHEARPEGKLRIRVIEPGKTYSLAYLEQE